VLYLNLAMFFIEAASGLLAESNALMADSLDMLGDATLYGFTLMVINMAAIWQVRAAILKGLVMVSFALGILVHCLFEFLNSAQPLAPVIGGVGFLALCVNLVCAWLLLKRRKDDLNMRSIWLCSRNDALANAGVLAAGGGVFLTGEAWPDLVVGIAIAGVVFKSSISILQEAQQELRENHAQL